MYSIIDYGAMIADRTRMSAFMTAMQQAIRPESVVIDIGTGTGIFALLACRLGARRVYAIEPADAIQVAREIASANGFADRIQFLQARSTDVTLPERGDVIVSDLGGLLPWFQQHIPSIVDARERLLAPAGVLIPRRDEVWAAVVDSPDVYAKQTAAWDDSAFGLDMGPARRLAVNTHKRSGVMPDQLLTATRRWATLDYAVIEDPNVRAVVSWTVTRSGTGHGIAAGLDRTLADGVRLSNAPDASDAVGSESIYRPLFFPWSSPVPLAVGDLVSVELRANLVGEDYIWCWNTSVLQQGQAEIEKANFKQSTLLGTPVSLDRLRKTAATYTPSLNEDGRMAQFVLDAMSQGMPLGEIATRLSSKFATSRVRDPLSYVAALSQEYG